MLHQVATINSSMSLGDALKRLEGYSDITFVVVRRQQGSERYWYRFRVGDIRSAVSYWKDKLDAPILEVLNLHEYTANNTVQVSEGAADEAPRDDGILLDGDIVVGVLEADHAEAATAGSEPPVDTTTGAVGSDPKITTDTPPGSRHPLERDFELTAAGSSPLENDTADFQAYPKLDAPDGIEFSAEFDLTVSLTKEQLTATTAPVVIADAPRDEFDLVVQLIAPGFRAKQGTLRILHVVRDDISANHVIFNLAAPDVEPTEPTTYSLEVQFSFNGNPCGRAWRDITVTPRNTSATDVPPAESGSSPLTTPGGSKAPDLTISITEGDEDGRFIWLFTSPHSVNLHSDKQIEKKLDNHNARSFAAVILKGIPAKDGTNQVGMHMAGVARQISDAMPTEFWLTLGEVWALVHAKEKVPRLLFLSAEPYVPWELASVENAYVDPVLLDSKRAEVLNAQVAVGRWLPPRPRTPRGGERPAQPPPNTVYVSHMAVVTGDYLAINGIRPLPEATAEGEWLTKQYKAIPLTATWDDIERLLQNEIKKNNRAVDIELIHFACHGQVDLNNPNNNGIILSTGNMRLDPTTARGNKIGSATQPFAFLNACEVGMAGESLGSYGGLAAAFLNEGFRGFVAPLWAVNDELAHQFAVKFYEMTLKNKLPVAEALRELRMEYNPKAPEPSSTQLAYIFYGHPDLVLNKP